MLCLARRRLLQAARAAPLAVLLGGCAAPLPQTLIGKSSPLALTLLGESIEAHGRTGFQALRDINVGYTGEWRPLIGRLQPALVDAGFRGSSEERLLLGSSLVAQAHTGPSGRKQVLRGSLAAPGRPDRAQGDVQVWFNGQEALDTEKRAAAALVADAYALFLLGPLALVKRDLIVELGDDGAVDGHACRTLQVQLRPGLGFSRLDQVALYIDRDDALMRRVRLSLNGLASTQGAVVEVDTADHVKRHGVMWPTRFSERLLRPIPLLPVHDWRLIGLDVNRGYGVLDIARPTFGGAALRPALKLSGSGRG
ncbi:hypothetical protein [Methylibium sp.]|uniref:hypothetical protein n=1 Tax=Methylibium sp. TaxID=2067992 RepID=UPI00286AFA15|nr:hypothetical protein [Methylibium sp.]